MGDGLDNRIRVAVRAELKELLNKLLPDEPLTPAQKAAETKRRNGTHHKAAKKAARTRKRNAESQSNGR